MHLRSRVCCLLMGTWNAYQREAVLRSPLSCPSPSSDGNTLGVGLGCFGSGWGLDTDREEAGVAWSDTSGRGASSAMEGGRFKPRHPAVCCHAGGFLLSVLQTRESLRWPEVVAPEVTDSPTTKGAKGSLLCHLEWRIERRKK